MPDPQADSRRKADLGAEGLNLLRKDFVVLGKRRVRSFHGWLFIGVVAGATLAIVFVANQSGQFISSEASPNILPPSAGSATGISSSQINLAWTNQDNSQGGIVIERSLQLNGTFVQVATSTGLKNTYSDMSLARETSYYYRLRSFRAQGRDLRYSEYTSILSGKTLGGSMSPSQVSPPSPPPPPPVPR